MRQDIDDMAYQEWKEQAAEDYAAAQRQAFKDGFQTAAKESEGFEYLARWVRQERDEARERYDEYGNHEDIARYYTLLDVLGKLSAIDCYPIDNDD